MYLEHFKLREFPFQLAPDADFLYMSDTHRHAKAYMDYTVWNHDGFVVITGEIGSGKTTLIEKLLSELDQSIVVAKIFQTQLDEVEFLQAVLVEFGLNPFSAKKVELLDMLNTFLMNEFSAGNQLVLIVDDAHNLSPRALEELRLLSGLETRKQKVLHVILAGQPQLNHMLETPELEQLLQRVRLRYHLTPLSLEQIRAYIVHRLEIAGRTGPPLFSEETYEMIYQYTGGIPRLINALCDTSLVCGYADDEQIIDNRVLKTAIKELQWQPYAKRPATRRTTTAITARSDSTQGALREHARALLSVSRHLDQLHELIPALTSISVRMATIETQLRRIAETSAAGGAQQSAGALGGTAQDWTDVGAQEELPPGSRRAASAGGTNVVIFNIDGTFHALGNACTHDGGDLSAGEICNGEIICPRDGARFSIKTGAALMPSDYRPLQIFPVRVEGGRIQVRNRHPE